MRLIDANTLKKKLMKPFNWNNSPEEIQEQSDFNYFEVMIDAAPTVDAVPVVQGKWLPVSVDPTDPYFRCSVCHYGTDTIFDGGDEPFKYCPNCGAKMDGGTE